MTKQYSEGSQEDNTIYDLNMNAISVSIEEAKKE